MIARIHKHMKDEDKGFTLIELLVVVIIIGILAAIAIPAFLSQRKKAWEKQVVSDLKNATTAAEAFATGNDGSYVGLNETALTDNGYRETEGVTIAVTPGANDDTGYTLVGTHDKVDGTWTYTSETGVTVKS